MNVRFMKYCPWSYGGGRVRKYHPETVHDIRDKDALEMIRCGYAEEVEENSAPANRGDESVFDEEGRREFYKRFSKDELVALCRENVRAYRPSAHRNISDLTELILSHEKENGILRENEDE